MISMSTSMCEFVKDVTGTNLCRVDDVWRDAEWTNELPSVRIMRRLDSI